jgi:hypothetical protein
MKKIISALAALTLGAGLALVGVFPASAHTPSVADTCEALNVTLTNYAPTVPGFTRFSSNGPEKPTTTPPSSQWQVDNKPGPGNDPIGEAFQQGNGGGSWFYWLPVDAKTNKVTVAIDGSVSQFNFGTSFSKSFPFANKYVAHTWRVEVDAHDDDSYDRTWTGVSTPCTVPTQPGDESGVYTGQTDPVCVVPANGKATYTSWTQAWTKSYTFNPVSETWVLGAEVLGEKVETSHEIDLASCAPPVVVPTVSFEFSAVCGALTLTTTSTDVNPNWYYGIKASVNGVKVGDGAVLKGSGVKTVVIPFDEDSYGGSVDVVVETYASTEQDLLPEGWALGEQHHVTVDTDCAPPVVPEKPEPRVFHDERQEADCDYVTTYTRDGFYDLTLIENVWVENAEPTITEEGSSKVENENPDASCAPVSETPPPAPKKELAYTGVGDDSGLFVALALGLLIIGGGVVTFAARRANTK